MILKLLLNTQMIWMIFVKILKNNPNKKNKIIAFDLIADMLSNQKRNRIVLGLFIRSRNLNMSFVFITQSYYENPKQMRTSTKCI